MLSLWSGLVLLNTDKMENILIPKSGFDPQEALFVEAQLLWISNQNVILKLILLVKHVEPI